MGGSSSQPQSSQPRKHRLLAPTRSLRGNNPDLTNEEEEGNPQPPKEAGWKSDSENNERGNARKKDGFWVEVMEYIESKTKMEGRRTYDMVVGKWKMVRPTVVWLCGVYSSVMRMAQESGAGDEDYVQKAMVHYQAETGLPLNFRISKRHKSSGSSSFNTESRDASINLNNIVADDEVQEIQRPGGRDKAKAAAKNKASKVSTSSTMNDDALAKLVVNEMTAAEVEQREAFIELKKREVECRERKIAATGYQAQQEDMKLYLHSYDHLTGEQRLAWDEVRAKIKAKYNLQF
nr:hypothetical protein [Tanacetum cinerariifolium]